MNKRILSFTLILIFLMQMFISCTVSDNDGKSERDPSDNVEYIDISKYRIIRPYSAGNDLIKSVSAMKKQIKESTGADISVAIDIDIKGDTENSYDLIVGNCDLSGSKAALEKLSAKRSKKAFIIDVVEKKISVLGISESDTLIAISYFIKEIVKKSPKKNCVLLENSSATIMKKTGELLYVSDNGSTIVLDDVVKISEPKDAFNFNIGFSYGKIIKLESSGKNNGILLATNENTQAHEWDIYRSHDDGKTWQTLNRVPDTINKGIYYGYQPYLFELPEDVGKYKKGTVLFAGCSYSPTETNMFLTASTDLGESWNAICNVAEGRGHSSDAWSSDGVWEPVLKYENGRLYCFYSEELVNGDPITHAGGHCQRLVYKYTTDLVSWSDVHEMVALDTPHLRPGMVALTKMGNGKWALAYEIVGDGGAPIYLKFADTLDSWTPSEKGKALITVRGQGLGSGPAIAWTPNGGECGVLFATASGNWGGPSNGSKCDLFLSFDYGETFISIKNPINDVHDTLSGSSGYSAGMFVDKNGYLYYVNNPEWVKGSSNGKLMLAKIQIF